MTSESKLDERAVAFVQTAGLDARFAGVLDILMRRLRRELGVPDEPVEEVVEEELLQTRERLGAFKAEHDEILARLVAVHVGQEHLEEALALIADPRVRRLVDAMARMEADLTSEMVALSGRMRQRAFEP